MFDYDPESEASSTDDKIPVKQVKCGGMHTVVLTPEGKAYAWGCNDEGALGRAGADNTPTKVSLPEAVTDVSCGDNHTIFYNTTTSNAYFVGAFRDVENGHTT